MFEGCDLLEPSTRIDFPSMAPSLIDQQQCSGDLWKPSRHMADSSGEKLLTEATSAKRRSHRHGRDVQFSAAYSVMALPYVMTEGEVFNSGDGCESPDLGEEAADAF